MVDRVEPKATPDLTCRSALVQSLPSYSYGGSRTEVAKRVVRTESPARRGKAALVAIFGLLLTWRSCLVSGRVVPSFQQA